MLPMSSLLASNLLAGNISAYPRTLPPPTRAITNCGKITGKNLLHVYDHIVRHGVDTHPPIWYAHTMSNDESKTLTDVNFEGQDAYPVYDNPYPKGSASYVAWDSGFWFAADEARYPDGYEDDYDYAVDEGMYDDDPSPYAGDYSEC